MKKIIILCAVAVVALCSHAKVTLGFDGESYSQVGIYIKDLATGRVLAENNANSALVPASITKSVTAAAALTRFGRNFRFDTPVYLYGTRSDSDSGTWLGNLVVETCGDPTIDSDLFQSTPFVSEIINGLRHCGISSISGRIIVSEPMPDQGCPPQWEIEDAAWAYGAGWFGLNYMDNTFKLWPATGESRPHVPDFEVTTIEADCSMTLLRGFDSNHLFVYAKDIASPNWRITTSMPNPAVVFTYALQKALGNAGIALGGETVDDESTRLKVCDHQSPLMADMLRQMMYESHNLFAEGMLRALAPEAPRTDALKVYNRVLQSLGVDTRYVTILDGSGLSRGDRLRPKFVSDVLEAMAKGENATTYAGLFPVAGRSGTVKSLLKKTSLEGKLALKSGSMNGVQCFAGYKLDAKGNPTHTVVIQVNAFFCPRGQLRGAIEKFLTDTFK